MESRKVLVGFEIQEEIERVVTDEFARKYSPNIRFDLIVGLRKMGKKVVAVMLKNNQIACIIQSPLFQYFEDKKIDDGLFAAGLQYSRDYFISAQDNMAKQSHDGTGINYKNFKKSNKEPTQHMIEAHCRLEFVKRELGRCSYVPQERYKNKRYVQIVELFLEQEKSMEKVMEMMKIRKDNAMLSQRIFEALKIMQRTYERLEREPALAKSVQ